MLYDSHDLVLNSIMHLGMAADNEVLDYETEPNNEPRVVLN